MPDRARVFRRKGSRCWYCWIPKLGGGVRPITTGCTDKRAAEAVAAELERRAVDPAYAVASATTLERIVGDYIADLRRQKRAADTIEFNEKKLGTIVRLLVDEGVGPKGKRQTYPLTRAIDHPVLNAYIDVRQQEGVLNTTILKELRAFGAAWKLARKNKLVTQSLDEIIPKLDDDHKDRKRALSPLELVGLACVLPRGRMAVVAFVVATGCDYSAIGRAMVLDAADRSSVHIHGSKRGTRDRVVPIPLDIQRSLLDWALANADGGIGGRLFGAWPNIRNDLAKACVKLGIERVSPNDLRRTYGKWLRLSGIEPHMIGPAMGHADGRMAERVYAKLSAEELAEGMALRLLGVATPAERLMRAAAAIKSEKESTDAAVESDESSQKKEESSVRGDRIELPTRGFSIRDSSLGIAANVAVSAVECAPNESGSAGADGGAEPPLGPPSVLAAIRSLNLSAPVEAALLDIRAELAAAWLDPVRLAHASVYGGRAPDVAALTFLSRAASAIDGAETGGAP